MGLRLLETDFSWTFGEIISNQSVEILQLASSLRKKLDEHLNRVLKRIIIGQEIFISAVSQKIK